MSKGNFDVKKLASLPNFYLPTLSHDEKKLAFYYDKSGRLELYVMDLETREHEQVTDGELPRHLRSGFIWGRDNKTIFFTKDVEGTEKNDCYSFNTITRELKELSIDDKVQEYIFDSSPDGEWISIGSNRHGQMNVFKMKIDGSEQTQLTATDNPSFGGTFSPVGNLLAFVTNEEGDLKNQDIYLLNLETGDVERILQIKVGSQEGFTEWSKDGKSFAFTTDSSGAAQPGIFNMETRTYKLFGDGKVDYIAQKLTKDAKKLICLTNYNSSISPVIFDVNTGDMKRLDFPPGIAAGGQLKEDRYLFLTVNMPSTPSSLVMYDLVEEKSEILLAPETGEIDASLFVDAEHVFYDSLDGTPIPAIVYKPRDFDPSKKYPAIVNPHGGPTGQYFMNYSMFAQILTDLGYVFLLPNVRGSTGYGVEFRDACIRDWGGKDHEDWIAGRQYLVDQVSVDPDRVAVFGGSYGGYATLVCMTKSPDLWAAGIAWVPVSHLQNLYADSMEHFRYYFRMQMGDPEKDKELWEERSPLNYAENVLNPLILIHGENDPRCPVTESTNFADALDKLGRKRGKDGDYEMVIFSDEGHGGISDIQGRIRSFEVLLDFLDRRMPAN